MGHRRGKRTPRRRTLLAVSGAVALLAAGAGGVGAGAARPVSFILARLTGAPLPGPEQLPRAGEPPGGAPADPMPHESPGGHRARAALATPVAASALPPREVAPTSPPEPAEATPSEVAATPPPGEPSTPPEARPEPIRDPSLTITRETFRYPLGDRRDPFVSLLGNRERELPVSLSTLRLTGILEGEGVKLALLEDPSGRGYPLRIGERVGGAELIAVEADAALFRVVEYGEAHTITLHLVREEELP